MYQQKIFIVLITCYFPPRFKTVHFFPFLDKMDRRYGILSDSVYNTSGLNFGMEMTIREYENALLQIEKHEANIKDHTIR
jgi:hypothetical protein